MKEKIYFNNLNGIRSIAAFMVIFSHIELSKSYFNFENIFQKIKHFGELGVVFFFVLSGFLITFLLLKEKELKNDIAYKNFYLRRILRIWPLYFVIVILSLFILPHFYFFQTPTFNLKLNSFSELSFAFFLFLFFLPNLLINFHLVPFATQTWSIGTEEQFYLIWPWVINNIEKLFLFFIILIVIYNSLIIMFSIHFLDFIPYHKVFYSFLDTIKIDCLTIGAIGAYFLYTKNKIINVFKSTSTFIITLLILVYLMYNHVDFIYFNFTIFSVLFLFILMCLVVNKKLENLLENKMISYLGKISYGLYMYHQMIIVFVINSLLYLNIKNDLLVYTLSIVLTIIVSGLSFEYFEKPFLKIKYKYAVFNNQKSLKNV